MEILYVFDEGTILLPEIFNMNPNDILTKFRTHANSIASVSLAIGQPNALSVPHMIVNAFKNLASIALETGLTFKQLDSMKSSAPSGGSTTAKPDAKKDAPKKDEPKKEEVVEEAGIDMGGMFDDF